LTLTRAPPAAAAASAIAATHARARNGSRMSDAP
jgi:hypothetical protein